MPKWKKGQPSPNPKGRPKLPDDIKELKRLTSFELERVLNEFLYLTPAQLKQKKEDPEATMLELLIISIITHGVNKGDQQRMGYLIERIIGKMKETVDLNVNPYMDKPIEELEALVRAKLEGK